MMNMMTTINNSSIEFENDDDQSSFKIFIDLVRTSLVRCYSIVHGWSGIAKDFN